MRTAFRFLSLSALLLTTAVISSPAGQRAAALFLLNAEPSVRLASMGGLYSGISAEDAFSNPAALGWTVNYGAAFAQWPSLVEGARYNYFGAVIPGGRYGSLNISYLDYATPSETVEEIDGTTRSVRLEEDRLVSLGYGLRLTETLFAGANLKFLDSTLASDYKASAVMGDLGLTYTTLDDRQSFGAVLRNCGQTLTYYSASEELPREIQFGYSVKTAPAPRHSLLTGFSVSRVLNNDSGMYAAGVEYLPGISFLSLRAGLKKADSGPLEYTAGMGVNFGTLNIGVGYGGMMSSDDGLKHDNAPVRFAVSWLFGPNNDYARGEAYCRRGMKDKAERLWDNIEPEDIFFAKAQESLVKMGPRIFEGY